MHVERLKQKPKNKTIDAAIGFEHVNWSFQLEDDWKIIGRGVSADA